MSRAQTSQGEGEVQELRREVARLDKKAQRLDRKARKLDAKGQSLKQETVEQAEKIEILEEENRLLKLQLNEYRDKFYKKNKRKDSDDEEKKLPKKRGAPNRVKSRKQRCLVHLLRLVKKWEVHIFPTTRSGGDTSASLRGWSKTSSP